MTNCTDEDSCNDTSCGCGSEGCGCGSQESGCCDKLGLYLWLAKSAKMEILKQKMQQRIEKLEGKKLDRIADVVVDFALAEWHNEADSQKRYEALQAELERLANE